MSGFDRAHPFPARLLDKRALTAEGSARRTLHVALSIAGADFPYQPGDVVAVYAHNPASLVDAVLSRLALAGDEMVQVNASWQASGALGPVEMTLRHALTERLGLGSPPLRLLRAAAERIEDEDEAIALEDLCEDDAALDAYLERRDLLDFLDEHPSLSFDPEELTSLLQALQPRTFSVASSEMAHPGEVHLTVGIIRWEREGRRRIGVASAHFEEMKLGDTIPLYWQASRHFRMPAPEAPLILIGPGTGIAPFRGFLEERAATGGAPVWLFFGAQTQAHDFYYRAELERYRETGTLARLDLAFSRDQPERIYVQQRMREAAAELNAWLARGAHVYVCGDASRMAPDVERALAEILDAHDGGGSIARLKAEQRYRRDVY